MSGEPRSLRSRKDDPQALAAGVRRGDLRAIARLITFAERDEAAVAEVMPLLQPHTGRAHIVGITGAPGCGKSTMVDQVIAIARAATLRVGVVAVDPAIWAHRLVGPRTALVRQLGGDGRSRRRGRRFRPGACGVPALG